MENIFKHTLEIEIEIEKLEPSRRDALLEALDEFEAKVKQALNPHTDVLP